MKTRITFLTSVVAFAVAASAVIGETPKEKDKSSTPNSREDSSEPVRRSDRLGGLDKTRDLLGMNIKDSQDETLGEVRDLAVDLKGGRIVQVVVSTGGVLGVGKKYVAIPPGRFSRDRDKKVLRLSIDKQMLKTAPEFELSKWEDCCTEPRMVEVYKYYGEAPYFTTPSAAKESRTAALSPLGYVASADKLIGTQVLNNEDEKLGKVENLLVDLPAGRLVQVVVSSGGFLGLGDELSVIPPAAFKYDPKNKILRLDVTKQALADAPHFKGAQWGPVDDPKYASEVYKAYRIQPYFSTNSWEDADNTGRNTRDRDSRALTPLDQGGNKADLETTRKIRKDILARDGLSRNARNIKIITMNGQVTLRGPVNTAGEKQIVEEIANQAVPRNSVVSQIEVKTF
ncbi:MAG: PRC-barrel domain-containing protein [Verrucomicrobia bacterium]|nr:PRC-barrel domain-containing protein [Verrucomicrobiota bacterium]